MLGSNPSAVPGAETEGPGHQPGVPPTPRPFGISTNAIKPNRATAETVAYRSTRAVTFTPNQHTMCRTRMMKRWQWLAPLRNTRR